MTRRGWLAARRLMPGLVALALSGCAFFSSAPRPPQATVRLVDARSQELGVGTFTETAEGVRLQLKFTAAPPGTHALHIHATGLCEPPQFISAGGHFNPTGKQHGKKNPAGYHLGDLPNLQVKDDGTAKYDVLITGISLGPGPGSLVPPGGTSLILHQNRDDEVTDPAGNAGPRVACGVITLKR
ncbi:MAG: superoxide dismutase family protein [Gemmatimonadota bacterium]